MGLEQQRNQLASALNAVPDVTGHAYRPDVLSEGDAWPILGRPGLTRDAGTAFKVTWLVRVVMPQDERAATRWWDARWPYLFEALSPIGLVLAADPVLLDAAPGPGLFAFEITLQAEE